MSGFSADWLALREPADHRARDRELAQSLAERFSARDRVAIVDLGCGAGSNLRALAPVLPPRQDWRLVDHDPALLAEARDRIARWADEERSEADGLLVRKADKHLSVVFRQANLAADLEGALSGTVDLVTAAALFDLVSPAWIERFTDAVVARGASFATALTYNGEERWEPPHPADAEMLAAFHRHQQGDKGFGGSAGPRATTLLADAFQRRGYAVRAGESPWRLEPGRDAPLIAELALGIAQAVRETRLVPEPTISAWLEARLSGAVCTVGHTDLLAVPGA
jgi:SAM-dependent methyltransferase